VAEWVKRNKKEEYSIQKTNRGKKASARKTIMKKTGKMKTKITAPWFDAKKCEIEKNRLEGGRVGGIGVDPGKGCRPKAPNQAENITGEVREGKAKEGLPHQN